MVLCGFAPGMNAAIWEPGTAKKIPAGSRIIFQVHYSKAAGSVQKDRSMVGLLFAKQPPRKANHHASDCEPLLQDSAGSAEPQVHGLLDDSRGHSSDQSHAPHAPARQSNGDQGLLPGRPLMNPAQRAQLQLFVADCLLPQAAACDSQGNQVFGNRATSTTLQRTNTILIQRDPCDLASQAMMRCSPPLLSILSKGSRWNRLRRAAASRRQESNAGECGEQNQPLRVRAEISSHSAAGPQARWRGASDDAYPVRYVRSEQQSQRACGPQPEGARSSACLANRNRFMIDHRLSRQNVKLFLREP